MASARVLTTNELGAIWYQRAALENRWPVEVRLLPQHDDTEKTRYTLHTPDVASTLFTRTRRAELRASMAAPAGALVYEVLRNGLLVSTGGLEVRPPDATALRAALQPGGAPAAPLGAGLAERPPSGARQLALSEGAGPDARERWPVRFEYRESPWLARHVSVVFSMDGDDDDDDDDDTPFSPSSPSYSSSFDDEGELERHEEENRIRKKKKKKLMTASMMKSQGNYPVCAVLTRKRDAFVGETNLPVGEFRYRFRVLPHEPLLNNMAAAPTRLGWDDGAMVHAWEFMTWPLALSVKDLAQPGARPGDGLMRLDDLAPRHVAPHSGDDGDDEGNTDDDDDDDDDADDDDDDDDGNDDDDDFVVVDNDVDDGDVGDVDDVVVDMSHISGLEKDMAVTVTVMDRDVRKGSDTEDEGSRDRDGSRGFVDGAGAGSREVGDFMDDGDDVDDGDADRDHADLVGFTNKRKDFADYGHDDDDAAEAEAEAEADYGDTHFGRAASGDADEDAADQADDESMLRLKSRACGAALGTHTTRPFPPLNNDDDDDDDNDDDDDEHLAFGYGHYAVSSRSASSGVRSSGRGNKISGRSSKNSSRSSAYSYGGCAGGGGGAALVPVSDAFCDPSDTAPPSAQRQRRQQRQRQLKRQRHWQREQHRHKQELTQAQAQARAREVRAECGHGHGHGRGEEGEKEKRLAQGQGEEEEAEAEAEAGVEARKARKKAGQRKKENKKKKSASRAWGSVAVNAAMFVLGSALTVVLGSAHNRHFGGGGDGVGGAMSDDEIGATSGDDSDARSGRGWQSDSGSTFGQRTPRSRSVSRRGRRSVDSAASSHFSLSQ